jgi:hypothetical protein
VCCSEAAISKTGKIIVYHVVNLFLFCVSSLCMFMRFASFDLFHVKSFVTQHHEGENENAFRQAPVYLIVCVICFKRNVMLD